MGEAKTRLNYLFAVLGIIAVIAFLCYLVTLDTTKVYQSLWTKKQKIELENVHTQCDLSFFCGISTGMTYNTITKILGDNDELEDISNYQEVNVFEEDGRATDCFSYETEYGELLCFWDGDIKNSIWRILFSPNTDLQVSQFLKINDNAIKDGIELIKVYEHEKLRFKIYLTKKGYISSIYMY